MAAYSIHNEKHIESLSPNRKSMKMKEDEHSEALKNDNLSNLLSRRNLNRLKHSYSPMSEFSEVFSEVSSILKNPPVRIIRARAMSVENMKKKKKFSHLLVPERCLSFSRRNPSRQKKYLRAAILHGKIRGKKINSLVRPRRKSSKVINNKSNSKNGKQSSSNSGRRGENSEKHCDSIEMVKGYVEKTTACLIKMELGRKRKERFKKSHSKWKTEFRRIQLEEICDDVIGIFDVLRKED